MADENADFDPIEHALAEGLRLAALAGQWAVVSELGRELSARRLARENPSVAALDVERVRRQRG